MIEDAHDRDGERKIIVIEGFRANKIAGLTCWKRLWGVVKTS